MLGRGLRSPRPSPPWVERPAFEFCQGGECLKRDGDFAHNWIEIPCWLGCLLVVVAVFGQQPKKKRELSGSIALDVMAEESQAEASLEAAKAYGVSDRECRDARQ